jgi:hypothetical protein
MLIVGSQEEEGSSDHSLEEPQIRKSKSKSKKKKSAIKQQKYCAKLSVPRIRENRPPPDPYSYDYYFDEKDSGFSKRPQTRSKEKWDSLVTSSNSRSSRISPTSRKKGTSPVRYLEYTVPLKDGIPNALNEVNPKSESSTKQVDDLGQKDQEELNDVNLEDKEDDMRSTVTYTNSDKSSSADDFKVMLTQSHPISAPVPLQNTPTQIIKKVQFPDHIKDKKSSTAPNDTRTTWDASRNKIKTEENSETNKIGLFNNLVNPLQNVKSPQKTKDFHWVLKTKEKRTSASTMHKSTERTLPVSIMKPIQPTEPVKKRGLFNFADKYAIKLL